MQQCLASSSSRENKYGTLVEHRCKRAAKKGIRFCCTHDPKYRRGWFYVVSRNYKPYQRKKDGSYHKYYIALPFEKRIEAWRWMEDNWEHIARPVKGRRFVSASVERIKGELPL